MRTTNPEQIGILKEIFNESNSINLPDDAIIIQAEHTSNGPALIVKERTNYFFYIKLDNLTLIKREVDRDEVFSLERISEWTIATMTLSLRKQRMRIPTQCVMRAVGFRPDDIDLFLDNEGKFGLSGRLRQMDWYKSAHPEIKTAALKLFAHLGLFEQQKIERRLSVVSKVTQKFTLLEIHNLFGGLSPGVRLKNILEELDASQSVDRETRKRYDPTGRKAIEFFLKNIDQEDFKSMACYVLTHYLPEINAYNARKQSMTAALESAASQSPHYKISQIGKTINQKHNEVISLRHTRAQNSRKAIADKQIEIESLRRRLKALTEVAGDKKLRDLLDSVEDAKSPFSIDFIREHFNEEVCFPDDIPLELADSAKRAGYRNSDVSEVRKLCQIFQMALNRQEKVYDFNIKDSANDVYRYAWLSPDNPDLYTVAMLCGGTCMRPNYAGEAALWESALSKDVAICSIVNNKEEIVAYIRVNYDPMNHGIYIDTIESRLSYILNNEDIWRVTKRALIDMAEAMERKGIRILTINFREERGNRLKVQWDKLPVASLILNGRAYRHPSAAWPYGDDKPRLQKEVWSVSTAKGNAIIQGCCHKICLADNTILGRGANATVYALDDQKIVKLFQKDYPIRDVMQEYKNASLFHSCNIPSPRCIEVIEVENRYGIIFERVHGVSLTKAIQSYPQKADCYIDKMITISKYIHSVDICGLGLESIKYQYLKFLDRCRWFYSNDDYESMRRLILSIPDRFTLLHGDFHTENIMVDSNDDLTVIDFAGIGYGHPLFDLMAEGAVIPVTLANNPQMAENYFGINADRINTIWDTYIGHFLDATGSKYNRFQQEKDIILMSRLRNAVTAAIARDVPEEYLRLCAQNTHHYLIPEIPNLIKKDWSFLE